MAEWLSRYSRCTVVEDTECKGSQVVKTGKLGSMDVNCNELFLGRGMIYNRCYCIVICTDYGNFREVLETEESRLKENLSCNKYRQFVYWIISLFYTCVGLTIFLYSYSFVA